MPSESVLLGTPSDSVPGILATGRSDVAVIYTSMSARHPAGRDAEYLQWHSFDHRPEQHRLKSLRASFRLVSTPACRAARAASDRRYDAADHVMTYLFDDLSGLPGFNDLSMALAEAGRTQHRLPLVERSVYRFDGVVAAPRIKAGADVLPWWPAKGVYLLIERGDASPAELTDVPGVGGVLWGGALPMEPPFTTTSNTGLQVTYCFLDEDPAEMGAELAPLLEKRWNRLAIEPLLAAPFYSLVPYDWDRYLP